MTMRSMNVDIKTKRKDARPVAVEEYPFFL